MRLSIHHHQRTTPSLTRSPDLPHVQTVPPFLPAHLSSAMPPKSSPSSDSQSLGSREQGLFKQLVRLYETKQYKKALKAADSILRKHATHGETLAMKGLVYNQLKRREDAHQLVKRGLEANFNSHVCWHVYGLIYRSEMKYEQAIKCFDERTQLLAFDGTRFTWMGLDDLLSHYSQHPISPPLLLASYNPHTEQLDYQPISHPPIVKHGQHSMVHVRHEAAADSSNDVELSVTDDHTMFVRLDCDSGSSGGGGSDSRDDSGGSNTTTSDCLHEAHYSRVEARQLLGLQEQVKLPAAARNGVNTSNLPRPRAAPQTWPGQHNAPHRTDPALLHHPFIHCFLSSD